jgi:hypothetical protein
MAMNPRLLRPTASGFNPKTIAGLSAWWDSTDNSKITTDTGVSAWVDKVNGYTLAQSIGANQPTISSINGKQAFDYNGSTQVLTSTDAGLVALATGASVPPTTIFYVVRIDVAGQVFPVVFGNTSNAAPFYSAIHPDGGSLWRTSYRNNASSIVNTNSTAQYAASTPYVIATSTSSDIVGRVNGAQVVSASSTAAAGAITVNVLAVGALVRTSAASFLNGQVGDVLIYNRVLTASEIQRVERWLSAKFGITLA